MLVQLALISRQQPRNTTDLVAGVPRISVSMHKAFHHLQFQEVLTGIRAERSQQLDGFMSSQHTSPMARVAASITGRRLGCRHSRHRSWNCHVEVRRRPSHPSPCLTTLMTSSCHSSAITSLSEGPPSSPPPLFPFAHRAPCNAITIESSMDIYRWPYAMRSLGAILHNRWVVQSCQWSF